MAIDRSPKVWTVARSMPQGQQQVFGRETSLLAKRGWFGSRAWQELQQRTPYYGDLDAQHTW